MNKKLIVLLLIIFTFTQSIIFASGSLDSLIMDDIIEIRPKLVTDRTLDDLQIDDKIIVDNSNRALILKTPKVDESKKIYDFADLFTDEEEKDLCNNIMNYIEANNYDMAIVTIDENNKSSAQAYADDFYDYNDFGIDADNSGILFLIDMDNRKIAISTTGNCIDAYTDFEINKILDSAYSYISNSNYYKTANSFISEASKYVSIENANKEKHSISEIIVWTIVSSTIITLIVILVQLSKHKKIRKGVSAIDYFNNKDFKITRRQDQFLTTHTSKIYDPPSSSSSGGSSSHSGSSGISHGGGSRSF